jgi:hypothetical protein
MNVTFAPPAAADAAADSAADGAAADGAAADGAADSGADDVPVVPHAESINDATARTATSRPDRCVIKALPPLFMD